jgi:hypothetical protein
MQNFKKKFLQNYFCTLLSYFKQMLFLADFLVAVYSGVRKFSPILHLIL